MVKLILAQTKCFRCIKGEVFDNRFTDSHSYLINKLVKLNCFPLNTNPFFRPYIKCKVNLFNYF